ncbi:hypothetical protein LEM8419_02930 [Neolewinella maritima]|uniref:Alpha-amylase n=1 Tax=Neolewinella maritima TaxID=1383882 RepID=A0ABM9B3V0_9BACT|nr:hypothetical protein [Neolewinella maritima]CAH1002015.1 hypothetical protein LEM8419_02930 [Neolewinella maritima]
MELTDLSTYRSHWQQDGHQATAAYTEGRSSYIADLPPQLALELSGIELAKILYARLGAADFTAALNPQHTVASHLADRPDGEWLKRCNTVGINVRTIGSFWNVLKYALTLPDHIRGIHLLPIWEPGVVGSLYGMASWNLNPEFLDLEALRMYPQLRTVEAQLKVVINLLHTMGKFVGMDVIPHTDRYSEMVLANPSYFEWLRRDDLTITDHREQLHEDAKLEIVNWLNSVSDGNTYLADTFFTQSEAERLIQLFGQPQDHTGRRERRVALVDHLYRAGLEPVPATMAPPYRGLEVDPDPAALTVDEAGRRWRDYRITQPTEMSRVFGPLTRFKLYGRQDDNRDWAIDFDRPRPEVWTYFTSHYADIQAQYGFDFMRGDMSHVQMRPAGVPEQIDDYYDPLRAVKLRIAETTPHFAYFAESFLTPPDYMAYGDEVQHLMASEAEVTLGNLQSMVPGSSEFMDALESYLEIAEVTSVTPAFTAITGDKDDPRFDHFYHHGELARVFTGLFMDQLPLYYSLGFEQRDRHLSPAPNEVYTKLYVFQERNGPKSVTGPWQWGSNLELFTALQELHRFAAGSLAHMGGAAGAVHVQEDGVVYWQRPDTYGDAAYLFVVNFAAELRSVRMSLVTRFTAAELLYAWPETVHHQLQIEEDVSLGDLGPGAIRCYRLL